MGAGDSGALYLRIDIFGAGDSGTLYLRDDIFWRAGDSGALYLRDDYSEGLDGHSILFYIFTKKILVTKLLLIAQTK